MTRLSRIVHTFCRLFAPAILSHEAIMSDTVRSLPLTRQGQTYLCQARYGFFRNGMACYLLEFLDAAGEPVAMVQVHPRDIQQPHRPEELDELIRRVCISDWLHALDDVLLRRARGELALPAWFNLGFEQL